MKVILLKDFMDIKAGREAKLPVDKDSFTFPAKYGYRVIALELAKKLPKIFKLTPNKKGGGNMKKSEFPDWYSIDDGGLYCLVYFLKKEFAGKTVKISVELEKEEKHE